MNSKEFHGELVRKMDIFAHCVYNLTKQFPKEELFGITSQLRRAALSVVLNYIEGYARKRKRVVLNFLEISYGSLKESKYLLHFTYKEKFFSQGEYQEVIKMAEEIGAMLWTKVTSIEK